MFACSTLTWDLKIHVLKSHDTGLSINVQVNAPVQHWWSAALTEMLSFKCDLTERPHLFSLWMWKDLMVRFWRTAGELSQVLWAIFPLHSPVLKKRMITSLILCCTWELVAYKLAIKLSTLQQRIQNGIWSESIWVDLGQETTIQRQGFFFFPCCWHNGVWFLGLYADTNKGC